jgi:hypothetical protein
MIEPPVFGDSGFDSDTLSPPDWESFGQFEGEMARGDVREGMSRVMECEFREWHGKDWAKTTSLIFP